MFTAYRRTIEGPGPSSGAGASSCTSSQCSHDSSCAACEFPIRRTRRTNIPIACRSMQKKLKRLQAATTAVSILCSRRSSFVTALPGQCRWPSSTRASTPKRTRVPKDGIRGILLQSECGLLCCPSGRKTTDGGLVLLLTSLFGGRPELSASC